MSKIWIGLRKDDHQKSIFELCEKAIFFYFMISARNMEELGSGELFK